MNSSGDGQEFMCGVRNLRNTGVFVLLLARRFGDRRLNASGLHVERTNRGGQNITHQKDWPLAYCDLLHETKEGSPQ